MSPNQLIIGDIRDDIAATIGHIKELEAESGSPVVQELILARRCAEDARMRLGVALAYLNEEEPFKQGE